MLIFIRNSVCDKVTVAVQKLIPVAVLLLLTTALEDHPSVLQRGTSLWNRARRLEAQEGTEDLHYRIS